MNVPPLSMWLSIARPAQGPVRLWLPLFLLWLLLLPLLLLAFALTVLADVVLFVLGQEYHRYTLLLLQCCAILGDTRGMVVSIKDGESAVDMTFF